MRVALLLACLAAFGCVERGNCSPSVTGMDSDRFDICGISPGLPPSFVATLDTDTCPGGACAIVIVAPGPGIYHCDSPGSAVAILGSRDLPIAAAECEGGCPFGARGACTLMLDRFDATGWHGRLEATLVDPLGLDSDRQITVSGGFAK